MTSEENNRGAFRIQEYYFAKMRAPIYAAICASLACAFTGDSRTGRRVLDCDGDPTRDAVPLRLMGATRARAGRRRRNAGRDPARGVS